MPDELVTIRNYMNPWEAEWARGVLASSGICCLIPDAMQNYMYNFAGPIRVQVPSSVAEEAERVLAEQEFSRKLVASERTDAEEDSGEPPEGSAESAEREEEPDEAAAQAIDAHDVCPMPEPKRCPACGGTVSEPVPPPPYAGESALGGAFKRLMGHGWLRCASCGHQWET